MKKINCAIVGVGNCASALVQGVDYYTKNKDISSSGITFPNIAGYDVSDVQFVAAYDIDKRKVGQKLTDAIFAKPNCCFEFNRNFSKEFNDPIVEIGPEFDGVANHMQDYPDDQAFRPVEDGQARGFDQICNDLVAKKVDIIINYLPVGSQEATEFWARVCLRTGISLLNCIPVFIASHRLWNHKFIDAGIPLVGDDMRSQFGASIVSAVLQELLFNRGHEVDLHYQDNVGGNTDFLNMLSTERLSSKKISKENVIKNQNKLAGKAIQENTIHAGPANYFSALGDNKRAHWLIKARGFGGSPVEFTADLSVNDSPNSAGVVIDAIRFLKFARDNNFAGALFGPSAFTQKTPPIDMHVGDARHECEMMALGNIPDYYVVNDKGYYTFNSNIFFKHHSGAKNI